MADKKEEKITKGINLATFEFREALAALINQSGLPFVNTRQAVGDVYNELLKGEQDAIAQERKQYEEQLAKTKEGGKEDVKEN